MSKQAKLTTKQRPWLDYFYVTLTVALGVASIALSQVYRIQGVAFKLIYALASIALIGAVFLLSSYGKAVLEFAKLARIEFLKIVWPTQQEAGRMTVLVVVSVSVLSVILWGLDGLLFSLVRLITG